MNSNYFTDRFLQIIQQYIFFKTRICDDGRRHLCGGGGGYNKAVNLNWSKFDFIDAGGAGI